ncbi:MAG: hypothetical protein VX784_07125, partial [Pseudomonadota bacterium]|nr:hypothetical protein [Pseudomonadota bacterium]
MAKIITACEFWQGLPPGPWLARLPLPPTALCPVSMDSLRRVIMLLVWLGAIAALFDPWPWL